MAVVDSDLYWPRGRVSENEKIPGTAILQQRDGKDEPITLAGNMVLVGNLWVPVSAANRLPVDATLSGRTEPIYEQSLPVSPLGGNSTYTSPTIDCKEFEFPNGSKGVVSISALAQADAQGTLYLEGRNAESETWVRLESVAVNNTGRGLLQRTNIAYRFVRLRFHNGEDDQTEFSLSYTLWQVTDGRGNLHGQGADGFFHSGPIAPETRITIMDVRSAVELRQFYFEMNNQNVEMDVSAYKDDGSLVLLARNLTAVAGTSSYWSPRRHLDRVQGMFTPYHPRFDPEQDQYAFTLDPSMYRTVWPKGLRVWIHNPSTETAYEARVAITCTLL